MATKKAATTTRNSAMAKTNAAKSPAAKKSTATKESK
jgi:hypothetical protein